LVSVAVVKESFRKTFLYTELDMKVSNWTGVREGILALEEGAEVQLSFDLPWVALSFFVSLCGSLAAVNVMSTYRNQSKIGKSMTILVFGILLGGVSIWSMHFIGLTATKLSVTSIDGNELELPQRFSPSITFVSVFAAMTFVSIGGVIAGTDPFFGRSAEEATEVLRELVHLNQLLQNKQRIRFLALFRKPWRLLIGGFIAGSGVIVMHNLGFLAMRKQGLRTEFIPWILVLTMFVAWIVASIGFWIIFRFLQWMPDREDARIAAAIVIACAVCLYHFSATFAVRYFVQHSTAQEALVGVPAFDLAVMALVLSWLAVFSSTLLLVFQLRSTMKIFRKNVLFDIKQLVVEQMAHSTSFDELTEKLHRNVLFSLRIATVGENGKGITSKQRATVVPLSQAFTPESSNFNSTTKNGKN